MPVIYALDMGDTIYNFFQMRLLDMIHITTKNDKGQKKTNTTKDLPLNMHIVYYV